MSSQRCGRSKVECCCHSSYTSNSILSTVPSVICQKSSFPVLSQSPVISLSPLSIVGHVAAIHLELPSTSGLCQRKSCKYENPVNPVKRSRMFNK